MKFLSIIEDLFCFHKNFDVIKDDYESFTEVDDVLGIFVDDAEEQGMSEQESIDYVFERVFSHYMSKESFMEAVHDGLKA